ncbi:MAG: hypothetical protein FD123_874 [Bacteroidetes bacterium]|nr:MAG: hypothetical protein FD123_874 [Bacteroidota bacterium]
MNFIFQPPFTSLQFSSTIKVELFEGPHDEALLARYTDSDIFRMAENTLGHSNITVAGYYGFGIGFFVDLQQPSSAVYTLQSQISQDQLVKIADSIEVFYEMLKQVYAIWQSDARKGHLPQTGSTINKMNQFLQYMKKNSPGSSLAFWQLYFFGDLHIGLEL